MSFSETIFLFFLALVIFGPKKLPEIARQVGKYLNEFKRASNEFRAQIEQEISHIEVENKQTILPPVEAPAGATSRTSYATELEVAAEVPALTAPTSENGSSSSEGVADQASLKTDESIAPDHAVPDQASPAGSDPADDVTASDSVAAAIAPESHTPESHA